MAIVGIMVLIITFGWGVDKGQKDVKSNPKTEVVREPTLIEQATEACKQGMDTYYDRGMGFTCPDYLKHQEKQQHRGGIAE